LQVFGTGIRHFFKCHAQMDLQAKFSVWYDFYRFFIFGTPKRLVCA